MWIFDFIFPKACISCKSSGETLCARCIASARKSISIPYPWLYSTYSFKDPLISKAIKLFKYYHRKDLLAPLVQGTLTEELKLFIGDAQAVLVPIPSPKRRILLRGYSHSLLLAKEYSMRLSIPYQEGILKRKKYTAQQAKIRNGKDRFKNNKDAFYAIPSDIEKQVVLVDDTATTGATLFAAKEILHKAGYRNIKAITLAH